MKEFLREAINMEEYSMENIYFIIFVIDSEKKAKQL